ncbi:MAG: hypothetical protein KJZ65_02700 [Phycisphaerales bacterium]|nr:hypothetical protein [Phycisphaerales bacterium]
MILFAARLLPSIAMLALGVAGLAKSPDLQSFAASLQGWKIVPPGWEIGLAPAIVAAEVTVAVLWFLWIGSRGLLVAALLLLLLVTGAFGAEAIIARSPDCHCYGILLRHENHQSSLRTLMTRNILLMAFLSAGLVTACRRPHHPEAAS